MLLLFRHVSPSAVKGCISPIFSLAGFKKTEPTAKYCFSHGTNKDVMEYLPLSKTRKLFSASKLAQASEEGIFDIPWKTSPP